MPEPTSKSTKRSDAIKEQVLANINSIRGLHAILKDLDKNTDVSLEDKADIMNLIFTSESKTHKYDLIPFLWNFLRRLYLNQNKLILKLVPSVAVDRSQDLTEKQVQNFVMITTPLCYMMTYHQDSNQDNVEVICKNVVYLTKCLLKEKKYADFFTFLKETIFNTRTYKIRMFTKETPVTEFFLKRFLGRLWDFREVTEKELKERNFTVEDLFEKFFQFFLFYINYESCQAEVTYKLTDEIISVLLNLNIAKPSTENGNSKDIGNCIKCLYYLVQLMKAGSSENDQLTAAKGLYQYMARICDKSVLNTHPLVVDTLATIGFVLEKNKFFTTDGNIKALSKETVKYLLQTIKLTVSLNAEPQIIICEVKDCTKAAMKKHTITNLIRFAQKIFLGYVSRLSDKESIDEEILAIIMQLIIFHFHVMERLTCPATTADEHNDIRRIYSTFAHRTKANPHASVLKIFEILLKYSLQKNLLTLATPIGLLLGKYYVELNDQSNSNRIEWMNLCLQGNSSPSAGFDHYNYNWAVRKQFMAKEDLIRCLNSMRDTKLGYKAEVFADDFDSRHLLIRMLEVIATSNLRAFRSVEEALVDVIMSGWEECSAEVVNVLFYASENQLLEYKEVIERNREYFLKGHDETTDSGKNIALAVTHSLQYHLYVEKLRKDLKILDSNDFLKTPANLSILSMEKESQELEYLKQSLNYLSRLSGSSASLTPSQSRQVLGTFKRNIRHFQLAGMELEEVTSCALLYEFAKQLGDEYVDGQLLAMANLMNHIHFIIKDDECRQKFPHLIRLITAEGSQLFCSQVKNLHEAKESLQILIVFGLCNMIKLNADLGRREKCYDYLEYLKQKIDEINTKKEGGSGGGDPSVIEMQYNLISYELFVKYSAESKVNHLMVVREIFAAVRQMYRVSDLYALSLYDVLVELFTFSVPRYETKGLDFYIRTGLKYFMGLGSVTRILDILLMYSNWTLCCENLEKCFPAMDYVANIVTGCDSNRCVPVGETINDEENFKKIIVATEKIDLSGPVHLAVVGFKLNCLVARKCYIDRNYEQSRKLYEHAWKSYEAINERINNFALKMEFQQFFVNALFQLSNVYYKIGMSTESLKFCETTTIMISDIRVNRIALTQEARFQGMNFKSELSSTTTTMASTTIVSQTETQCHVKTPAVRRASPVSPIQMEMAMLMNGKKGVKATKKIPPVVKIKIDTPKKAKRKSKTNPEVPKLQINSPVISLPNVNENSSLASNQAPAKPKKEEPPKRKPQSTTTARKIPVRTVKVETKEAPLKPVTTGGGRRKASASDIPELTPAARKSTRRLI